jgi:hypothetical protein
MASCHQLVHVHHLVHFWWVDGTQLPLSRCLVSMKMILILILSNSIATAEFDDMAACQAAAKAVQSQGLLRQAICVSKSSEGRETHLRR